MKEGFYTRSLAELLMSSPPVKPCIALRKQQHLGDFANG